MGYQQERDQFIGRMVREGMPVSIASALLKCATSLQRYAELACSSEAADRDRVHCPATKRPKPGDCLCDMWKGEHQDIPRITLQADQKESKARALLPDGWILETQGDPRGYVLRVIPPSYAEQNKGRDRHNRDSIGVPTR